jgi:hypothetical protein
MKITTTLVAVSAALGLFVLTGCTPSTASTETAVAPEVTAQIDAALASITGKVFSTGPNGEEPSSVDTTVVSDEQAAQIAGMGLTAAIVMHYGGNDWANAQSLTASESKSLRRRMPTSTPPPRSPTSRRFSLRTQISSFQFPPILWLPLALIARPVSRA